MSAPNDDLFILCAILLGRLGGQQFITVQDVSAMKLTPVEIVTTPMGDGLAMINLKTKDRPVPRKCPLLESQPGPEGHEVFHV